MSFYNQLITSDWLGRATEDYTYEKRGASVGWEKTLSDGQAYSSFILNIPEKPSEVTLSKKVLLAKQLCTIVKNTILATEDPDNTRIIFCDEFENYAINKKNLICVTLQPLNKNKNYLFPTVNHAIDPIIGFTIHEMAHILYTTNEYTDYLTDLKGVEANLKSTIMNILEDERIERLIAHNYRGYANYLGKSKDYAFGLNYNNEKAKLQVELKEDVNILLDTFLLLVRYPKALEETKVNKFEKELKEIQELLKEGIPKTITEMTKVCDEIYKILLRFVVNSDSNPKNKAKAQMEEGNIDSDKGGSAGNNGDSIDLEDLTPAELEELMQLLEDLTSGMQVAISVSRTKGAKDLMALMDSIGGNQYDKELTNILKDISSYTNEMLNATRSQTHTFPPLNNFKSNSLAVKFLSPEKDFKGSRNNYLKAYQEVVSYSSSLRAKLKELNRNTEVTYTGLFEGDFDDGLLVDSIIGAKNIYKETHIVKNMGTCVGLLIDESGSMANNNNWFKALQIAVMFERALDGLNAIDFYCYGHTTQGFSSDPIGSTTLIKTYFEGRTNGDRNHLGYIYQHNANRDGHALLETVTRIRSRIDKNMPLVMFMLSDGEPSASVPNGYSQVSYLKGVVDKLEKDLNTTIIHIAIHNNIPSEKMFNHYVKFTDFNTLVRDVGNLLKKTIEKRQTPILI